jgi:hypothetical protein
MTPHSVGWGRCRVDLHPIIADFRHFLEQALVV